MRVRACDYDSERERERELFSLLHINIMRTFIRIIDCICIIFESHSLVVSVCLLSMNFVNSKNHLSSVTLEEDVRCLRLCDMYNFLQYFL